MRETNALVTIKLSSFTCVKLTTTSIQLFWNGRVATLITISSSEAANQLAKLCLTHRHAVLWPSPFKKGEKQTLINLCKILRLEDTVSAATLLKFIKTQVDSYDFIDCCHHIAELTAKPEPLLKRPEIEKLRVKTQRRLSEESDLSPHLKKLFNRVSNFLDNNILAPRRGALRRLLVSTDALHCQLFLPITDQVTVGIASADAGHAFCFFNATTFEQFEFSTQVPSTVESSTRDSFLEPKPAMPVKTKTKTLSVAPIFLDKDSQHHRAMLTSLEAFFTDGDLTSLRECLKTASPGHAHGSYYNFAEQYFHPIIEDSPFHRVFSPSRGLKMGAVQLKNPDDELSLNFHGPTPSGQWALKLSRPILTKEGIATQVEASLILNADLTEEVQKLLRNNNDVGLIGLLSKWPLKPTDRKAATTITQFLENRYAQQERNAFPVEAGAPTISQKLNAFSPPKREAETKRETSPIRPAKIKARPAEGFTRSTFDGDTPAAFSPASTTPSPKATHINAPSRIHAPRQASQFLRDANETTPAAFSPKSPRESKPDMRIPAIRVPKAKEASQFLRSANEPTPAPFTPKTPNRQNRAFATTPRKPLHERAGRSSLFAPVKRAPRQSSEYTFRFNMNRLVFKPNRLHAVKSLWEMSLTTGLGERHTALIKRQDFEPMLSFSDPKKQISHLKMVMANYQEHARKGSENLVANTLAKIIDTLAKIEEGHFHLASVSRSPVRSPRR